MDIILTEAERLNQWSAPRFAFKLPRRLDWIFARIEVTPLMVQRRREIENISALAVEYLRQPGRDLKQSDFLRSELCASISDARMRRISLKSSLIDSVAYNSETASMRVWLQSGRHVMHQDVPEAVYLNLISAKSPGLYYTHFIDSDDRHTPGRARWMRHPLRTLSTMIRHVWR